MSVRVPDYHKDASVPEMCPSQDIESGSSCRPCVESTTTSVELAVGNRTSDR